MKESLKFPKFAKPIRAAAIIETAHGVLLVQDLRDRFKNQTLMTLRNDMEKYLSKRNMRAAGRKVASMKIVEKGRFSLPGGGIEIIDYQKANAEDLLNLDRQIKTAEELEMFRQVVRTAAIREIKEEIGLDASFDETSNIIEIQGRQRDHIICVLRAEGEISINFSSDKPEITGIGFLNEDNVIPLNNNFFQAHVQKLMEKYIRTPERRKLIIPAYLSHIRIPAEYVEAWYENMLEGYKVRSRTYQKMHNKPLPPESSPTFVIVGKKSKNYAQFVPPSFTEVAEAKIVPPRPSVLLSLDKPTIV